MKTVAILQSNYIPWKGYFDMIAAVDEFILYDEVQFTKNDWRNRNRIKTPAGVQWLSIPVGQNIRRRISEVELPDAAWQARHWSTLAANYARARCYREVAAEFEPIYLATRHTHLSPLNRRLIEVACGWLDISTPISDSSAYPGSHENPTARLVSICRQTGATTYLSGPSAAAYLDVEQFASAGMQVRWFDYSGYPSYPQLWGPFEHAVSVLDLLFNCGREARQYLLHASRC